MRASLGVDMPYGGSHPEMGTHNRLLRLEVKNPPDLREGPQVRCRATIATPNGTRELR